MSGQVRCVATGTASVTPNRFQLNGRPLGGALSTKHRVRAGSILAGNRGCWCGIRSAFMVPTRRTPHGFRCDVRSGSGSRTGIVQSVEVMRGGSLLSPPRNRRACGNGTRSMADRAAGSVPIRPQLSSATVERVVQQEINGMPLPLCGDSGSACLQGTRPADA